MPSDDLPLALPDFLEARRRSLTFPLGYAGETVGPWQARLRERWHAALPPTDHPAEASVEGERVTLRFATGAVADGCLRFPQGSGPHPAVLLLHDHGGAFEFGWRKLFDLPESQAGLARHYGGSAPAEVFLARGFAVLCLDALGWGGRQTGGYASQQALAANAMHLGWSLAGIVAAEDLATAAWLARHPAVDARRVGAFGFSYGGFRAWQVAALSPEISAAACIAWFARRAGLMRAGEPLLRGQSAFYMLHPALAGLADFPDMAGLAAPKPLLFRSGRNDRHMPEDAVAAAWDDLARIWAAAGAEPPDCAFHSGAHVCPENLQHDAAAFLSRALRP